MVTLSRMSKILLVKRSQLYLYLCISQRNASRGTQTTNIVCFMLCITLIHPMLPLDDLKAQALMHHTELETHLCITYVTQDG